MQLVNLTPHNIVLFINEITSKQIAPSGTLARCAEKVESAGTFDGIPLIRKSFGAITGLPDPQEDTIYIVSALVASAAKRADVVCPGDPVRDSEGRIIGCKSLCRCD